MQMTGKTIVITGGTSGIGLESAVQLARLGARVVIVGRDPAKTAAKLEEIKGRSGSTLVESLLCDFSVQAQIRKLAEEILARCPRIDVLVDNAGSVSAARTLTSDGLETTFAVNHLGYVLLTRLLLDRIVASAPARIVVVASVGHYRGTVDFDDLGFERGYSTMRAYCRSKLGNVLFTRELARRLAGKGVTVNALHPGGVATDIWGHAAAWQRPILNLAKKLFMITPEQGGATLTYLASSPEVEGQSGLYFEKNKPKTPSALARDDALAAKLWDVSAKLVGLPA
jgi:retinol dehydrogenase 14